LAKGDEDMSAEIDNFIMEIILTGINYEHQATSVSGAAMTKSPPRNLFLGAPQARLFSTYVSHPSPYQEPLFRRLIRLTIEELEKESDLLDQSTDRVGDIAAEIMDLERFLWSSSLPTAAYGQFFLKPVGPPPASTFAPTSVSTPAPPPAATPITPLPASVKDWLTELDLAEYWPLFERNGFGRPDALLGLDENDLTSLGVLRGHQKIILRKVKEFGGR